MSFLICNFLFLSFLNSANKGASVATPDWQSEIRDGLRKENWSLTGPNRVVKVVPLNGALRESVSEYITLARFLVGLTPQTIENELGLPKGSLSSGACIYSLARLPTPTEYEYELTAKFPDGLAYNPAHFDERYGPGSAKIHQWKLKFGVKIPVHTATAIKLLPAQRFPYA